MTLNKNQIRKTISAKRKALSAEQQTHLSEIISDKIIATDYFQNSQHIALYLAHHGEVSLSNAIKTAEQLNKTIFLPVVIDDNTMHFYPYKSSDALITSHFGTQEPNTKNLTPIDTHELDLICMPLVAFDSMAYRIGRGKGYYDKALAFKQKNETAKPKLIGAAYDFQKIEYADPEDWDIPLDMVVTESMLLLTP